MKRLVFLCLFSCSLVFGMLNTFRSHIPFSQRQNIACNTLRNFGKTHFILGHNYKSLPNKSVREIHSDKNKNLRVFFTSKDDVRAQIASLIDQEEKSIKIAVFTFTDKNIADKLIEKQKKGISIEIITDYLNAHEQYSKIDYLCNNGIPVWCYNSSMSSLKEKNNGKKMTGRMHHKFALFSNALLTGSSNLTKSGQQNNIENIVIIHDETIAQDYAKEYERIKSICFKYQPMIAARE